MKAILTILISIILISCGKDVEKAKLSKEDLDEIHQKGDEFERKLRMDLNIK